MLSPVSHVSAFSLEKKKAPTCYVFEFTGDLLEAAACSDAQRPDSCYIYTEIQTTNSSGLFTPPISQHITLDRCKSPGLTQLSYSF